MAVNMKRKQTADVTIKPSKRQKPDIKSKEQKTQTREKPAEKSLPSVLTKEQPAFPRGGAGLLTPLERKQISAKAARDVAAEQEKPRDLFSSKRNGDRGSDSEEAGSDVEVERKTSVKKKSKKPRTKEGPKDESTVSIDGLSYKRLAVGSLVLGRISSINAQDLTMSLPNNLTGFVPLTSISAAFSDKIQTALQDEKMDIDDDEAEDSLSEIDLKSHFKVGQYLRVAVTSLGDETLGMTKSRRKITLSLDPTKTNSGLSKALLLPGCTVQVVVISVEDHGLVVDTGISDGKKEITKGFIPAKALGKSISLSSIKTGTVILCVVTDVTSNGKIIRVSPDLSNGAVLKNAPGIDAFLPGTLVEVLVSAVIKEHGLAGKVLGMLDVTADLVHSGSCQDRESFAEKYKVGQRLKARLLYNFPLADSKKLGFSLLEDVLAATDSDDPDTAEALKISSITPSARVVRVDPGLGIYVSLPSNALGFAHISRLSDKKVDTISETTGVYKLGSEHRARIIDYNSIDGLYILSLQNSVIDQPFLRVEDVTIGEKVKASIEKVLIGAAGVQGLIVKLAEGVTGMVPQIHMSDVTLLHPEKKFKEGQSVTARVLSVDPAKRQSRLTLKKTLINSDEKIWAEYEDIVAGETTVGTLVKVDPHGALVQFYGNVRGFLPVSEISEAYIKDATEHFKVGDVRTVNALSVNAEEGRLTVSCRDRGASIETSLASVLPGSLVSGTVFEKSASDVLLRLENSDVIARLALDHVSDGSERKRRSELEKIRVGQKLERVLVLDVQRSGRLVVLCNRKRLIEAAQSGQFLKSWEDLKEDISVTGYVSNITEAGIFVRFASNISALITKHQVPVGKENETDFGQTLLQAITARVTSIDYRGATPRFWLSMRQKSAEEPAPKKADLRPAPDMPALAQPVDDSITSFAEFVVGKVTKARVTSVKETQINVELAKDVQGRIDVSEVFDDWEDIKDRKQPLRSFTFKQVIPVRILGIHDTRNHRFLPLTHRAGKNTVFELSAKLSTINAAEIQPLSLSDMQVGTSWLAYVNNIVEDHLMVNVSPSVRGRIRVVDVSDDLAVASDLYGNFPLGSALKVKVKSIDLDKNHLDLTAKSNVSDKPLILQDLSPGTILPGRITKVSEKGLFVQLAENVVGAVDFIDMVDDYNEVNMGMYEKNHVVRVCVVKVDILNKKVALSTRPSKVLSSSIKAKDPEITSIKQLNVGDVVRGFVSNVSDKGLFITLGHGVTAFVRIGELFDTFVKSWKDSFQRDQLVEGKIISIDEINGHVQLSLKKSVISGVYTPPITFTSVKVGDIVTGRVVKVETFGVFILVDNSQNVRGLCHRSEIAEQKVDDASKLFTQGDTVKAKVLKLDLPNRKINFGMKASYFEEDDSDEGMEDADEVSAQSDDSDLGGVNIDELLEEADDTDSDDADGFESEQQDEVVQSVKPSVGLSVGGFDWFGMSTDAASLKQSPSSIVEDGKVQQKKKKRRAEIQVDRTGDLDVNGPQSTDDFERLLLGEPDSSMLWLQYMAFHLELGDIGAARQIGERALKTIGLSQDAEKLNVWIALLNLENAYGDDENIDSVFKRALQYNDQQEIYNRLVSIYIQSGKHSKADELFQEMLKKFTQDPKVYTNYGTFLFDTMSEADRGRAQLTRALQVLPSFTHFDLTSKFAQLEFKSTAGLPERGRTIFEGLINSFPKRVDLFNVLLDLEIKQGDIEVIRALFERIFQRKLKAKQAKYFFKRWLAFEEAEGDERRVDDVKAKAATWVKSQG